MKRLLTILLFIIPLYLNSQDIPGKTKEIIEYLQRNNMTIFKDGTVLSNPRAINLYLNELIQRIGKSTTIEFISRSKKNTLYKSTFMIIDLDNKSNNNLLGNIQPLNEKNSGSSTLYPMSNLDTITLVFRYKDREDLLTNDLIYLLNSMLYKDETLTSMIELKIRNNEDSTSEEKSRINSLTRDLLSNKKDIIDVSIKIINNFKTENNLIKQKTNRTEEENKIIDENNLYIESYQKLIEAMKS